jgi:AcrR family transcriptional regulator
MDCVTRRRDEQWPDLRDFRHALHQQLSGGDPLDQGLRQRKKNLMRQLISDTATRLFLERGFDEVRVSEVATACDVSEQTIYNYFSTKESLVLDREEDSANEIRRVLGPGATASPVDAVVGILTREMEQFVTYLHSTNDANVRQILKFNDLIETTPALKTARTDMIDRLVQVAAQSMAARAGVDPNAPEPQIAADALLGLWRIYYRAIIKHSDQVGDADTLRDEVLDDVRRAARLIDSGLWSFATAVQGAKGRRQLEEAAAASNDARKQVLVAIKEAREAWRLLRTEAEARARDEKSPGSRSRPRSESRSERLHQQAHQEAREIKQQVRQIRQEVKQEVKRAVKEARNP